MVLRQSNGWGVLRGRGCAWSSPDFLLPRGLGDRAVCVEDSDYQWRTDVSVPAGGFRALEHDGRRAFGESLEEPALGFP